MVYIASANRGIGIFEKIEKMEISILKTPIWQIIGFTALSFLFARVLIIAVSVSLFSIMQLYDNELLMLIFSVFFLSTVSFASFITTFYAAMKDFSVKNGVTLWLGTVFLTQLIEGVGTQILFGLGDMGWRDYVFSYFFFIAMYLPFFVLPQALVGFTSGRILRFVLQREKIADMGYNVAMPRLWGIAVPS